FHADARERPLHLRARGRLVRARGGGEAWRPRDRQLRERDRRARARARCSRHRARRRGHLPRVHVLRDGRGDRARGRDAGLRRHRPGDAEPRPVGRRTQSHGPDEGPDAGAPVRAPCSESRRIRRAGDRGRGAGLRRRGNRDEHRLDVQLLPDEEPFRARRRRPDLRQRPGARCPAAHAALPRIRREEGVPARRIQLAPRRDAGGVPAHLPAPHRRVEPAAARRGRALLGAPRRPRRDTGGRGGSRLPHVLRALAGARPAGCGARRRRHRLLDLLPAAVAPPACAPLPRLLGGRPAGDREGRAREPVPADVGGHHRGAAGRGRLGPAKRLADRALLTMRLPVNRHRVWQLVFDAVLIVCAWRLTFWLRFDKTTPVFYRHLLDWQLVALVVGIKLGVFVLSGFYNRFWRYVSTRDMWSAARGVTIASALTYSALYAFPPNHTSRLPHSIAAFDFLLLLAFVAGTRLLARTLIERPRSGIVARGKEVLIVGAGYAGQLMVREMQRNRQLHYTPIGFVDDDPRKRGDRIHGVRVLGTTADLAHVLRDNRPDEVLIAIPSAPGSVRQRILEVCRAANVPVKTLPGLNELISGDLNLAGQIRPVQVEDVLGRQQVEVDLELVASYLDGRTVVVTGAGGSIGSELCRQLARLGVARLVLVEQAESALYEIERELVDERDFTAALPVLADCGDRPKMRQVFERYRPQVVFHAAAYKHVPMLEANPLQAVANNVLATRAMAEVSVEFGVKRFVLISTDKAANPQNLLGYSKAVCEWIVESFALRDDVETRFVAVRFGNVLAS